MPRNSYVYLSISGEAELEEIVSAIPLAHHKISTRTEARPSTLLRYAHFETHEEIPDVYALAEQLADVIEPEGEAIRQAASKLDLNCCLQVMLWLPESPESSLPMIGFSKRITNLLATIDASIDIDCYRE